MAQNCRSAMKANSRMDEHLTHLEQSGFAVARSVVDSQILTYLKSVCAMTDEPSRVRRRGESLYGVRHLLSVVPELQQILSASPFIDLARAVLGKGARPVKGVYFDKTSEANWLVPWHQDVTITVKERRDVPGFEMRPVKEGFVHAIPPVEVSEQILAMRIHLDNAGPEHGALRVISGSHRHGRLDAAQVKDWTATSREEVVGVQAGDVMLMRPLLLHASSPCRLPDHRRVIHVEFAAYDLPGGLEWAG